tara:strand:+ start:740 stop:2194 length:1455 start_codon:yes stop_codon:yes gene_type:complete
MKQKRLISLVLALSLTMCGSNSTSEVIEAVEDIETTETQEDTQEKTQTEQNQVQQPPNSNPFLDPGFADCLINEFGEERYKQLQNERPTAEEEQRIGNCMGPPPGQGQSPPGQETLGSNETTLSSIHLSYLGSIRSKLNGLGNVADASIVEMDDGRLRVYFKNGNEPQANIGGFDNLIHSAVSSDGGRTWTIEEGVRVPVDSPIEALVIDNKVVAWGWEKSPNGDTLVRYESDDGFNFSKVAIPLFESRDCKDKEGNPMGNLGDPSITQLNDGSWLMHAQELVSPTGDFNRRACVATSPDNVTWTSQPDRMYGGGEEDVTTNPAIKRNSSGVIEWIWPTFNFMVYRSGSDGFTWSDPEYLVSAGDPDFLDLNNGSKLLAFGNFGPRSGSALIFAKRITSNYKITVVETLKTSIPSKTWKVEGARADEVKVVNICLDIDLANTQGASVEIKETNGLLEVTASDSNETFFNLSCVYILVGPEQVMG